MPTGTDLVQLAGRTTYVGSAEHKSYPSPAGPARLRSDASKCDAKIHGDLNRLTDWLREGIRDGQVGAPWHGGFPQYVWVQKNGVFYEGRLVNRVQGTYKGYPLKPDERPVVP